MDVKHCHPSTVLFDADPGNGGNRPHECSNDSTFQPSGNAAVDALESTVTFPSEHFDALHDMKSGCLK
eukprot:9545233-Karenia_brevis.AAC.1